MYMYYARPVLYAVMLHTPDGTNSNYYTFCKFVQLNILYMHDDYLHE